MTTTASTFASVFLLRPGAILALALALLAPPLPAHAGSQIYRWVDDNGVTHYGEKPPENKKETVDIIRTHKDYSSDADSARNALSESRKAKQEKQATPSEQAATEAEALIAERKQKQEQGCQTARQNLNVLSTHGRVREPGQNGEVRILSEEEHQNRIRETAKFIKENCAEH